MSYVISLFIAISAVLVFHISELAADEPAYLYFPQKRLDKRKRLLSTHNQWAQIGGDIKIGFVNSENDDTFAFNSQEEGVLHDSQPAPRFFLEEIAITSQFSLGNRMKSQFELSLQPDAFAIKRGFAVVYLPFHSFIQFGLDKRFYAEPTDNTIISPLVTKSFSSDEDLQIVIGGDYKIFGEKNHIYWKSSLSNGQRFAEATDSAHVGKQNTYPIFRDTRQLEDFDRAKEVGFGIGFGKDFAPQQWFEILGFGFFSKLNEKDPNLGKETVFLQSVIPGYRSTRRNRHRIGADAKIRFKSYVLETQYIHGLDGSIKRHAVVVAPSVIMTSSILSALRLNNIELGYRFNILDINVDDLKDNIPESPYTWDRITHTLALKFHSKYFFTWQNEFHFNQEKTGGFPGSVKNNEFLSQVTLFF